MTAHLFHVAMFDPGSSPVRVARLVPCADQQLGNLAELRSSGLWSEGGNAAPELGEAGLQAALASSMNDEFLRAALGLKPSERVAWVARELGGGGGMDVAAYVESDRASRLELIDCKVKVSNPGLVVRQAERNAYSVAADVRVGDDVPRQRLRLLWPFAAGRPPEVGATRGWRPGAGCDWFGVESAPAIAFLGLSRPGVRGFPEEFCVVGDWDAVEEWAKRIPKIRKSRGAPLCVLKHAEFSWARLVAGPDWCRIEVLMHADVDKDAARRPRDNDELARASPSGWDYLGLSLIKGVARFHWDANKAHALKGPADDGAQEVLEVFLKQLADKLGTRTPGIPRALLAEHS